MFCIETNNLHRQGEGILSKVKKNTQGEEMIILDSERFVPKYVGTRTFDWHRWMVSKLQQVPNYMAQLKVFALSP